MRSLRILPAITAALLSCLAASVSAQLPERTLCVWDIIGASGDTANMMRDFETAALDMGVKFNLRIYTDENIAFTELTGGQCDAAAITGVRGRQLNSFTGSLDSIGSIPNYDIMRTVIQVLSSESPKINAMLRTGPYEVMGIAPMGAAYLFVKDQSINNVQALAGKSIAVMEYDVAQGKMAAHVGMSPVMSDITNFSGRFNNHSVDICFAPVAAYTALELYRGMQPDGGIVRYTLGQLTLQLIGRHERLPADFPAKARKYFSEQLFDRAMKIIQSAYDQVDERWWIEIPAQDRLKYDEMMRESRIKLRDEGVYSAEMMSLLRNIRCRADSGRAECAVREE